MLLRTLILLITLLLSGCLSPVNTGPSTHYVINTLPCVTSATQRSPYSLFVTQPQSTLIYRTNDMIYTLHVHESAAFAKHNWATTPAEMLQTLIVQTLEKNHRFKQIAASPSNAKTDYILNTTILEFQQDFTTRPSRFRIHLRFQLINASNQKIIRTFELCAEAIAISESPQGGVIAANRATEELLGELARKLII